MLARRGWTSLLIGPACSHSNDREVRRLRAAAETHGFRYQSLSILVITRQARARAQLIQPPLSHLVIEPEKTGYRRLDRMTTARREDCHQVTPTPPAVVLHDGFAGLNLKMWLPPFVPQMNARSPVTCSDAQWPWRRPGAPPRVPRFGRPIKSAMSGSTSVAELLSGRSATTRWSLALSRWARGHSIRSPVRIRDTIRTASFALVLCGTIPL